MCAGRPRFSYPEGDRSCPPRTSGSRRTLVFGVRVGGFSPRPRCRPAPSRTSSPATATAVPPIARPGEPRMVEHPRGMEARAVPGAGGRRRRSGGDGHGGGAEAIRPLHGRRRPLRPDDAPPGRGAGRCGPAGGRRPGGVLRPPAALRRHGRPGTGPPRRVVPGPRRRRRPDPRRRSLPRGRTT